MDGHYLRRPEQLGGEHGVEAIHRVVAADRNEREVQPVAPAGQREVAEERGVAEVVDPLVADLDDDPGRRADRPLGRRRGVPGRHPARPSPLEADGSAEVGVAHVVARGQVRGQLAGELHDRGDARPRARGDRDGVADVVGVPVRQQDRVGGDLAGVGGGLRVAGQERVDQDGRPVMLERDGGVAEEADGDGAHGASPCSGVSVAARSSSASSSPIATPISMPMRVSSATSVRTAVSRSAASSSPATRALSAAWAPSKKPPSSSAVARIDCRPGAAWVTISCACAKRCASVSRCTAASTCAAV